MTENSRETIQLTVNGKSMAIPTGSHVGDLLSLLQLTGQFVAVERNRRLVPHATYGETPLSDGDRLEVVSLVGGG